MENAQLYSCPPLTYLGRYLCFLVALPIRSSTFLAQKVKRAITEPIYRKGAFLGKGVRLITRSESLGRLAGVEGM